VETIDFFVPGPLPGMNEMIDAAKKVIPWLSKGKKKVYEYSAMKKKWTAHVAMIAGRRRDPLRRVKFQFLWVEPNKRRDPDNIMCGQKFVMDGVVAAGIIKKDGWAQVAGSKHEFMVDKKRPGVLVRIMEVEP